MIVCHRSTALVPRELSVIRTGTCNDPERSTSTHERPPVSVKTASKPP